MRRLSVSFSPCFCRKRFITSLPRVFATVFGTAILADSISAADWPQWRGPLRNGVQPDSPRLLEQIPASGLKELWESELIPSNDEGGLSSPIAANGKVFVSLVWHRDIPSETRQIDELVLRQLGFQGLGGLSAELVAKMEQTRESIPPTLRGKKLEEFVEQWVNEHLDSKQKQLFGGFVSNRFKKGRLAIPLEILEALDKHKSHLFATESEMKQWLDAQGWPAEAKSEIVAAVPPTTRVAEDAIVCLDLATGKTQWKATAPGAPLGRTASATPCLLEGSLFAVGSSRVWCVEAATGRKIWETELPNKQGIGSSPLAIEGRIVINAGMVAAFEAKTGHECWRQEKAGGGNSSPVAWNDGKKNQVVVNGRSEMHALDLETGQIVWSAPGGGDSTPAVVRDVLVVQARKPELGLVAYVLGATGAARLWNVPMDVLRNQSSPIIHDGLVYVMDDDVHGCFDLRQGTQRWRATVSGSAITSPALADGKLLVLTKNGNALLLLKADGTARVELGKATVRSQWVPSPCIADGRLVLRMKDKVKCWSLLP